MNIDQISSKLSPENISDLNILMKKAIKSKIEFETVRPWISAPPVTSVLHRHHLDLCVCGRDYDDLHSVKRIVASGLIVSR